jgi:hypothetical protein
LWIREASDEIYFGEFVLPLHHQHLAVRHETHVWALVIARPAPPAREKNTNAQNKQSEQTKTKTRESAIPRDFEFRIGCRRCRSTQVIESH